MNLGSIKDKSQKRKRKNALLASAVLLAVGVIGTVGAISFSGHDAPVKNTGSQTQTVTSYADITDEVDIMPEQATASENVEVRESMLSPIKNATVIKGYADDMLVYSSTLKHWETHTGIDLAPTDSQNVLATLDGTVISVVEDELMGNTVTLQHSDDIITVYSSLDTLEENVIEGAPILRGQSLGMVGVSASSEAQDGAHLHFEVYKSGAPINPESYLTSFEK